MADPISDVISKIGEGAAKLGESAKDVAEKAFSGVKDFTSNVAGQAQSMQKGVKLNSDLNSKKQELEEAYSKLGRLAYQHGGLSGEMQEVSDHIHEIYRELQAIELQINKN
ncbi:MAG: hypothetical protein HDQ87_01645 [Clostridia bacterium]|nr:hypothetical protein [Clostridia bacterium]